MHGDPNNPSAPPAVDSGSSLLSAADAVAQLQAIAIRPALPPRRSKAMRHLLGRMRRALLPPVREESDEVEVSL